MHPCQSVLIGVGPSAFIWQVKVTNPGKDCREPEGLCSNEKVGMCLWECGSQPLKFSGSGLKCKFWETLADV